MKSHELRVVFERDELKSKLHNLVAFIASNPVYPTLPRDEQDRLTRQQASMRIYLSILDERIAGFGKKQQPTQPACSVHDQVAAKVKEILDAVTVIRNAAGDMAAMDSSLSRLVQDHPYGFAENGSRLLRAIGSRLEADSLSGLENYLSDKLTDIQRRERFAEAYDRTPAEDRSVLLGLNEQ